MKPFEAATSKQQYMNPLKSIFILIITAFSFAVQSQTVTVNISNIQNSEGILRVAVFTDNESFKNETPFKSVECLKNEITKGKTSIQIQLKPGTYGISVLDDENNSGNMDYKYFTIPKEGFGFSDYYHTSLLYPNFTNFSFTMGTNNMEVDVKIRYIVF